MKKAICVFLLLVSAVMPAIAEYSYTQEFDAGSYTVYLPLTFTQDNVTDGLDDAFGHPLTTARYSAEPDDPDAPIGDQIYVSFGIDAPFAAYKNSGEIVDFWNNLAAGSPIDYCFRRVDECIALTYINDETYETSGAIGIINGKDYLQISISSRSHDRAVELLEGILGGISAKEFCQP